MPGSGATCKLLRSSCERHAAMSSSLSYAVGGNAQRWGHKGPAVSLDACAGRRYTEGGEGGGGGGGGGGCIEPLRTACHVSRRRSGHVATSSPVSRDLSSGDRLSHASAPGVVESSARFVRSRLSSHGGLPTTSPGSRRAWSATASGKWTTDKNVRGCVGVNTRLIPRHGEVQARWLVPSSSSSSSSSSSGCSVRACLQPPLLPLLQPGRLFSCSGQKAAAIDPSSRSRWRCPPALFGSASAATWRAPCRPIARGLVAGPFVCPDCRDRSLTGYSTSSPRGAVATCAGERDRDASWGGGFVDGFQRPSSHRSKESDEMHRDGVPRVSCLLEPSWEAGNDNEGESDVIFLGTGTSEGVPRVSCLTNPDVKCPVCWAAVQPGNKNRRRNTSLLIRYAHPDGRRRHIVIDAGKFFYHSALQWFPYFGVRELDAVIITHSHADAIGGLDDLRDWTNNVQESIEVYTSQRDFEVMKKTHYYIVDSSSIVKGTAVSDIEFQIISEIEPFFVQGLKVTPLPVWHGAGYKSLGFRVGNLCYISDVSEIPPDTYRLLENCEVLVLDALRPKKSSISHFALPQALEETRKIGAKKTLFTGMMHSMDHDKVNAELRLLLESEGLDVQLSYDGLRIPLPLAVNPPQLALANDLSPRDR